MWYYIPKYYLPKLNSLMKSLAKKTKVVYEVDENDTKLENAQFYVRDDESGNVVLRNFSYVVVNCNIEVDYKIGDYELVAELEHTGAGNIIRKINLKYDVPEMYRNTGCYCEHCKTNRARKNTFLLLDKSGNYKQVGSNCLNDYTGIDSESVVEKVSRLTFLLRSAEYGYDQMEEEFREYLKNTYRHYETVEELSNLFYQILLKDGYSKESDNPFHDLNNIQYDKELQFKVDELLDVINTNWYEEDNDYCHNVKMVLNLWYVEPKHWRILLSYLNSAMLYLERQKARELERQGLKNEYLGEIGQRIEFEVKSFKLLYTYYTYYTPYGEENYCYRFLTPDNHIIIWSTSGRIKEVEKGFELNDKFFKKLKGTIKNLEEYKGEKQTVITRGAVVNG